MIKSHPASVYVKLFLHIIWIEVITYGIQKDGCAIYLQYLFLKICSLSSQHRTAIYEGI